MFGFFKRKKSEEDPLSDLRTVSRWMQELPAGDIYSAQEQVVQSLIQFNHAGLSMSKERLQVLMHLDDQARDMQYSLCMQYLRNPRMSKVIESRLWTAIHAFFWEITRGYHAFVMDFVSNPGGSRLQSAIPQITARALRGFSDIFKWRYFRYERIDEKLWHRLHNLYRIAEFDGFQNNRFKVYAGDSKPSSCAEEYIQGLLLSPLGTGSLTPRQIEMVDIWLDNWSEYTTIETRYEPGQHFFYVDSTKGMPLRRMRENLAPEPGFRFLNTERLTEHLQRATQELKAGVAPATLGLGEEFRLPDGFDLLHYVSGEWSPATEQERRAAPREPKEGRAEVIRDLNNICNQLLTDIETVHGVTPSQKLSQEELLDIKLYGFVTERTKAVVADRVLGSRDLNVEQWPMFDRSASGVGVLLKNEDSEWVKVGKLLALRIEPGPDWVSGVVRRITRVDGGQRKVGVQTLDALPALASIESHEPAAASMSYSVDDAGADGKTVSQVLVFPSHEDDKLIILETPAMPMASNTSCATAAAATRSAWTPGAARGAAGSWPPTPNWSESFLS